MAQIVIKGLDELLHKLDADVLVAKPLREALERSAITVENAGREMAPVDTGHLRASLTHRLDARPVPLFAEVGTKIFYGRELDESPRKRYRRGPRKGQPTRGWLTGRLADSMGAIEGFLARAVNEIEALWRR